MDFICGKERINSLSSDYFGKGIFWIGTKKRSVLVVQTAVMRKNRDESGKC